MTKKKFPKRKAQDKQLPRDHHDRIRVQTMFEGESVTKQEFAAECDINNIMARYKKEGVITHINNREPEYGNVDGQDFAESMRIVTEAQTMFADLPSDVRLRFNNDPGQLLDFVQTPGNEKEMRELGLTVKEPPEASETPSEPPADPPAETPPEAEKT